MVDRYRGLFFSGKGIGLGLHRMIDMFLGDSRVSGMISGIFHRLFSQGVVT